MINERGNSDGLDVNGQPTEYVHHGVRSSVPACEPRLVTTCNTGAFNLLFSEDWDEVTCQHCLARKLSTYTLRGN